MHLIVLNSDSLLEFTSFMYTLSNLSESICNICIYNMLAYSLNCKFGCRLAVTLLWVHSLPVFFFCVPQ